MPSKVDELREALVEQAESSSYSRECLIGIADAIIEAARQEERERCAKVALSWIGVRAAARPSSESIVDEIRSLK